MRAGLWLLAAAQAAGAEDFSARLSAALVAHVASTVAISSEDVEVVSLGFAGAGCGDEILITGRLNEDYVGNTDLRVEALDGGAICGRWRIRARLAQWRTVPTASQPTAAGQPIALTPRRVRLERPVGTPVDPVGGPFLALAPMRAGEPVTIERVRLQPDVEAGAKVKLEVRAGALVIRGDGFLTQPGRVGESINVRAQSTGAILEGTLVTPGRVVVDE